MKNSFQIIEPTINSTNIDGLLIVTTKQIHENRGAIREVFRSTTNKTLSIPAEPWQQVNLTESNQGVIRGIHAEDMNKLVGIAAGAAFGAYVDLRPQSPTFGQVCTVKLEKGTQVFVPKGVGNGFQSTSATPSQYLYFFDKEWTSGMSGKAMNPLDADLAIPWPIQIDTQDRNLLSEKDFNAPTFQELFPTQDIF